MVSLLPVMPQLQMLLKWPTYSSWPKRLPTKIEASKLRRFFLLRWTIIPLKRLAESKSGKKPGYFSDERAASILKSEIFWRTLSATSTRGTSPRSRGWGWIGHVHSHPHPRSTSCHSKSTQESRSVYTSKKWNQALQAACMTIHWQIPGYGNGAILHHLLRWHWGVFS